MLQKMRISCLVAIVSLGLGATTGLSGDADPAMRSIRPLIRANLKETAEEFPEWRKAYESSQSGDVAGAERHITEFFEKVFQKVSAEYSNFNLRGAFIPAKFITESVPPRISVPVLKRIQLKFKERDSGEFQSAINMAIFESYVMWDQYEQALEYVTSIDPASNQSQALESGIFGFSTRLVQEGKGSLARTMCSNYFGSFINPKMKYCTNAIYYSHLGRLEQDHTNAMGMIEIFESLRTNRSTAYGEMYMHNFDSLAQALRAVTNYYRIAQVVASDRRSITNGTLSIPDEDRKEFDKYVAFIKKQGWLDSNYEAVDLIKLEAEMQRAKAFRNKAIMASVIGLALILPLLLSLKKSKTTEGHAPQ